MALDSGSIVAQGAHTELLRTRSLYQRMCAGQRFAAHCEACIYASTSLRTNTR